MTGLTQVMDIGASGLGAATQGMQTVSNNTANVNTPGYNVESVNQAAIPGTNLPPGGIGEGTDVTSIQRGFNQFVFQQLIGATASNQAAQAVAAGSASLASIFPIASGGAGGLGAALTAFFTAANQVAQDPTNTPDRQVFLSDAQSLAAQFQSVGGELSTTLANQNNEIASAVSQINLLTQQIAGLNQSIMAETGAAGAASNSLLDQRDQLVQQLSQEIGVTVIQGKNGAEDIYTNSGAALVNEGNSFNLAVASGGYGDGAVAVTYTPTGQDLTDSLSGGGLGGAIALRAQIVSAQDSVGGIAVALGQAVNRQQSLGLDLNGNLGQALFSVAGPQVFPAESNSGGGTLTASISNINAFVPGDFIITKEAGGFEATNTATGETTALGSGPTLSLDGMTLAVSGTINTGDSFKLEPTAGAAASLGVALTNPAAIAAAAPYAVTAGTLASGGAISDQNRGTVTATAGSPVTSGGLAAGATILPAGDFGQTLSVRFTSATSFDVLSSTNTVIASGSLSPANGAEIAIRYPSPPAPAGEFSTINLSAGTAASGDSFVLTPGGSGSNGNMVAMAGLASQNLLSGQSLNSAYATLVSGLGSRGQEAQVAAQASQAVLSRAQTTQQSISGVNLDEEAAKLVGYQQAYQAAAQVIASAEVMFNSLLNAVKG